MVLFKKRYGPAPKIYATASVKYGFSTKDNKKWIASFDFVKRI